MIKSIHEGNSNDISFTVTKDSLSRAESVAIAILPALGASDDSTVLIETNIAKVSISGAGMIGRPGVAAQMFSALANAGVNIQMISTSEVKVSCVVDASLCDVALATLRKQFDLENTPLPIQKERSTTSDKPVRGVALDLKQARLAIRHVPDRPGMAARIFSLLADNNISVD